MPRPTTKSDLIISANMQFDKMWELVDTLGDLNTKFTYEVTEKDKEAHWRRDKNLRDVFIHLYEWHCLALNWVKANQTGDQIIPFLPSPYNWRNYGAMNITFWEKHQNTNVEKSKEMLLKSHKNVIALIESFTDEELFEKSYFKWSGNTNIGTYFVSATCSHYDWAIKKIKRQIKMMK
ncbi:ClbS/DfsB family four-helix bundle protein [Lachnospiraceae bacterium OttesenSCG-928-E19]|nr:ClbS/DfsB family four-helix bundle protein [Lachnospiraceae bacterium OttesenSCG-928-E19]